MKLNTKESELVSGFMTEHSAVIFVFFFLAEYASLILMCMIVSILFLGGYNLEISYLYDNIYYLSYGIYIDISYILNVLYDYFSNDR